MTEVQAEIARRQAAARSDDEGRRL